MSKTGVQPAYDELLERAAQVFGSREVEEKWLHSPVQALCNQAPATAIIHDLAQVEAVLKKIEAGDFS